MIAQDIITSIQASLTAIDAALAALVEHMRQQDPTPALQDVDTHLKALAASIQALVNPA